MEASISPLASGRKRWDTAWNGWKTCSEKDRGCHVNFWFFCNHQVGGISSSRLPEFLAKSTWNSPCSKFGQDNAKFGGNYLSPTSQPSIPQYPNNWFIVDAMLHPVHYFTILMMSLLINDLLSPYLPIPSSPHLHFNRQGQLFYGWHQSFWIISLYQSVIWNKYENRPQLPWRQDFQKSRGRNYDHTWQCLYT